MPTAVSVGPLEDLAPGTARKVEVGGRMVALVRIGDDVYAIGDICTHQDISLSEGEVHIDECQLECWKHGSTFSLKTGRPDTLPATKAVPVFDVRVDGGDVYLRVPA